MFLIETGSIFKNMNNLTFLKKSLAINLLATVTLREKCWYSDLIWSAFFRIRTEHGEVRTISPHAAQMRENTDQKNSEYGHFLRSVSLSKTASF